MKTGLRHVFFDLDHTLWDFETNSNETLGELFEEYGLGKYSLFGLEEFLAVYREVNQALWDQYNRNQLGRDELRDRRFRETFGKLGLEDRFHPPGFSDQYIERCTDKPAVFPHTHEVLTRLSEEYRLSIITNGFPESQRRKMAASGLSPYFDHLIISEEVGYAKPHSGIFNLALAKASVGPEEAVMIGDNLHADIEGARGAGIDGIWFNPQKMPDPDPAVPRIHSLHELLEIKLT